MSSQEVSSYSPVESDRLDNRKSKKNICIAIVGVGVLAIFGIGAAVLGFELGGNTPHALNVVAGQEIVYRTDTVDNKYTKAMDDFVTEQGRILDMYGANLTNCETTTPVSEDAICIFQMSWLNKPPCSSADRWGFNTTSPCLIVTPVKDPMWKPEVYKTLEELPDSMPQSLKDHIEETYYQKNKTFSKTLWLSCSEAGDTTGQTFTLHPWYGFPAYYFPAKTSPAYLQPVLGLPLTGLQKGVKLTIECRIWAKNVDPEDNLAATIQITMEE